MQKLFDLRNYLFQRVPYLKNNPEQLHIFVNSGHIDYYGPDNYSHKYNATMRVVVTDWRGSVDDLTLPILEWLTVREPDRPHENVMQFNTQIIDSETIDIEYSIAVKETVLVHYDTTTGQRDIEHILPAPTAQMNNDAALQFFVNGPTNDDNLTLPTGAG